MMKTLDRRKFLGIGCTSLAAGLIAPKTFSHWAASAGKTSGPTPVIHCTDLFHIGWDLDDYFDLACNYALAYSGNIDLQGVLIDYPFKWKDFDPEPHAMGVAQMNYYTGLVVPAVVGSPYKMKDRNDIQSYAGKIENQSIYWIINTLKKSPSPVVIHIVGTSRNVAIALKKEPALFKEKCKGIYLNAGNAYIGNDRAGESNIYRDACGYAAIFDAPCPVYWFPCVNEKNLLKPGGEYGSTYTFLLSDILPFLPKRLQNFFLFFWGKNATHKWFSYLNSEPDKELLSDMSSKTAWMWSTAGILHAADKKVTLDGKIVPVNSKENSVFSLMPVEISCDDKGNTTWKQDKHSKNRFIIHIDNNDNYQKAMPIALKNLLLQLP
jgi:hypothetical protein